MIYRCCDDQRRRNKVQNHATLNGIDFLEVRDELSDPLAERQRTLLVHFLKPLTPGELTKANIRIEGGERIRNIQVVKVSSGAGSSPPTADNILVVTVSVRGDFSTYTLRVVQGEVNEQPPTNFDPILSSVEFSFKVGCPSDFDCQTASICTAPEISQPEINYLAKDYASFRQLILDRLALLSPGWKERNPADLGITLVELLAYVGDYLSYQQDAIATEAYLGTARRRASIRRHARLVDYLMHDGRNARTWVHFSVEDAGDGSVLERGKGANTTKLLTKVSSGTAKVIDQRSNEFEKALNTRPLVFELMHDVMLFKAHNRMDFYTWESRNCCLPKGATSATLRDGDDKNRLKLRAGDVLILAEQKGPETGVPEDADPTHRQAVLLTRVHPEAQVSFVNDTPVRTAGTKVVDPLTGVALVEIEWARSDALTFPLCISGETSSGLTDDISVALGNIALADHGMTFTDEPAAVNFDPRAVASSLFPGTVPDPDPALKLAATAPVDRCNPTPSPVSSARYRPRLARSPLSFATELEDSASRAARDQRRPPGEPPLGIQDALQGPFLAMSLPSATSVIKLSTRDRFRLPLPSVSLSAFTEGRAAESWTATRDLLASHPTSNEFVVEVETDGTPYLRFGDDVLGSRPSAGTRFLSTYRIGNGVAGNIGADTLGHLVSSSFTEANAVTVRNPLRAEGGLEPESIEEVRQNAPSAFRIQERAVTPADYEEIAVRQELADRCGLDIQRAAATPRWTGSWHTMFVTVDRFGGATIDDDFKQRFRGCLERFRMAGEDLEIDGPQFVSLEIEIAVCIKPGYYFSDVKQALLAAFSDRVLPNNQLGLFHPDNLSFGQPIYTSTLIAAAQKITGVESVSITRFQRQHSESTAALVSGKLELGRLEIARLANDPNFPERGSFTVTNG